MDAMEIGRLETDLRQFTGTTQYHRSTFGRLNITDGAHYLRDKAGCYWLIDIIESYYVTSRKVSSAPFQIWRIKVHEDKSAVVTCKEDTGLRPIVTQKIPYTDFPLDEFELYCIDGVVMLKSEY